MPTIEITDDQLERLRTVREDVSEAFAGPYGHVRDRDALDYLLDTYAPPDETDADVERSASTTEGASGANGDGSGTDEDAGDEDDGDDENGDADGSENEDDEGDAGNEDDAEGEDDAGDESGDADAAANGGGANRLQSMMSLLDDHDDKWRESGGDTPYEVDLPDGGTEAARTKDDVRRLLFKHY